KNPRKGGNLFAPGWPFADTKLVQLVFGGMMLDNDLGHFYLRNLKIYEGPRYVKHLYAGSRKETASRRRLYRIMQKNEVRHDFTSCMHHPYSHSVPKY